MHGLDSRSVIHTQTNWQINPEKEAYFLLKHVKLHILNSESCGAPFVFYSYENVLPFYAFIRKILAEIHKLAKHTVYIWEGDIISKQID